MGSTQAEIMEVMAGEVGRPEIFGHTRAGGYSGGFWKMAKLRNGTGLKKGRRRPDRILVWRQED